MSEIKLQLPLPPLSLPPHKIIGIHGHAYSGKDTTAEILLSNKSIKNSYVIAFADSLKRAANELFGQFNYSNESKEKIRPEWGISQRVILQSLGATMRKTFGEDIFIHRLIYTINNTNKVHSWSPDFHQNEPLYIIIPDVRYQNEVDWIYENDGTILHIRRPVADGKVGIKGHKSEASLILTRGDFYVIDNDRSLDDLKSTVTYIFDRHISHISYTIGNIKS